MVSLMAVLKVYRSSEEKILRRNFIGYTERFYHPFTITVKDYNQCGIMSKLRTLIFLYRSDSYVYFS